MDRDGEVILKKYSPIGELSDFAKEYAESLADSTGHIAMITDRDVIIAVSGASKKEFLEKPISDDLEQAMEDRKTLVNGMGEYAVVRDRTEKFSSRVVAPIIAAGDPIGSVVLLSREDGVKMGDLERNWPKRRQVFWLSRWNSKLLLPIRPAHTARVFCMQLVRNTRKSRYGTRIVAWFS